MPVFVYEKVSKIIICQILVYLQSQNLVIICPSSAKKLTKIEIRSSLSWFEYCSESLIWPIGRHMVIIKIGHFEP